MPKLLEYDFQTNAAEPSVLGLQDKSSRRVGVIIATHIDCFIPARDDAARCALAEHPDRSFRFEVLRGLDNSAGRGSQRDLVNRELTVREHLRA